MSILGKVWLLLLVLALVACGANQTESIDGKTLIVRSAAFHEILSVAGVLQPASQVDVGSQVSGQIKRLHVQLGDRVTKGQLLAEIDPSLAQADVKAAQASHDSLMAQEKVREIQLAQTNAELKRQSVLDQRGMVVQKDYEAVQYTLAQQQAELQGLQAQIRQSQSQLSKASRALTFSEIRAPISGVVVGVLAAEGQTLIAQQQAPVILKLANQASMTGKLRIPMTARPRMPKSARASKRSSTSCAPSMRK